MKKLLPIILLFLGAGAGVGAGLFLRPAPEPIPSESADGATQPMAKAEQKKEDDGYGDGEAEATDVSYVRLNNQFVVPIVNEDEVTALVVMSLSLEVPNGSQETVYSREPKLRDSFLQVLFDHANVGGFDGAFTNANNMDVLRNALREVARKVVGDEVTDILILEIARQDY